MIVGNAERRHTRADRGFFEDGKHDRAHTPLTDWMQAGVLTATQTAARSSPTGKSSGLLIFPGQFHPNPPESSAVIRSRWALDSRAIHCLPESSRKLPNFATGYFSALLLGKRFPDRERSHEKGNEAENRKHAT